MELYYVTAILDRGKRESLEKIYRALGLGMDLSMLGRGTAPRELLSLRGLTPTEKVIMATCTDGSRLKQLFRQAKLQLYIDIPGNGIMLAVPVKSAGGTQALAYLTGGIEMNQEKPNMNFEYELIYVILNEGYSDDVMDAARPAGAAGGTVIAAKGTGLHQAEKFEGMSLASEKEIVKSIEDGSVMTVAYAVDSSGSDSINVVISKVDPSDTENGMMTAARDALVPIFTDNGFSDVSIDAVNKTVAGESHDVLVINATIEGFNFYEQQMGAIKDGYSINITAANYGDDDTDTMLGNITKMD